MIYDAIIIGAGPAGLTAALYLLRDGKKVLLLEKESIGGAIASSPLVENYPGYKSISGADLTSNMYDQVEDLGVEIEIEEVKKITARKDEIKEVETDEAKYLGKVVIVATGSKYRTLGLPNEEKLIGHGIHFCVACDGAFFKDKDIAIIGGGNSAIINAYSMSKIAKHITIVQNLEDLTCEKDLANKIKDLKNIDIIYKATVKKYLGDDELTGIVIDANGKEKTIKVDGVFLSIGMVPQNDFIKDLVDTERGYIKSANTETNLPGVYVAGDARTKMYAQVTVATSDGTVAALEAIKYLNNKE